MVIGEKQLTAYDWDGSANEILARGEKLDPNSVIITGRRPEEEEQIKKVLNRFGYDFPIYTFIGGPATDEFGAVGGFKAKKAKELGVSLFYEDTPEIISILKKEGINVSVVKPEDKKFVWVTQDFSGIGFAKRMQDEGYKAIMGYKIPKDKLKDVEKEYETVGKGFIQKFPLEQLMAKRASMKDWIWCFDGNHNFEENEILRKEGFSVFEGGKFNDIMEHDRNFAVKLCAKYGLMSPPTFPFTDNVSAIQFLEQHEDTAYVFKPDEGENFSTYCPESEDPHEANKEMIVHLQHLSEKGGFILQERKNGVETNVEVHYIQGEPVFAFMCIESKKKSNEDLGDMIGCAFDFAFTIPLECDAVNLTVGKLHQFYKEQKFTGYADANIIFANDGVWFFEACSRLGYNSHPNLFFNLNQDKLGETIYSFVKGTFTPRFSKGFGSSVTFYDEHPKMGKSILFPEKIEDKIYIWDAYKEKNQYLTAGYDNNILICLGYGYTIPTAWENVMDNAHKVKFKGRTYRTDGDETNYFSSPLRRYEAIVSMGLLEDKSMHRMHKELSDKTDNKFTEAKKTYEDSLAKEKDMHKTKMNEVKKLIKDAIT